MIRSVAYLEIAIKARICKTKLFINLKAGPFAPNVQISLLIQEFESPPKQPTPVESATRLLAEEWSRLAKSATPKGGSS